MGVIKSFFRGIGVVIVALVMIVLFVAAAAFLQATGTKVLAAVAGSGGEVTSGPIWNPYDGSHFTHHQLPGKKISREDLIPGEYRVLIQEIDNRFGSNQTVVYLPDQDSRIRRYETRVLVRDEYNTKVFDKVFQVGTPVEEIALAISNHRE